MSWWVKNHIAVNDDETKQLCSIEADNQTSLPAADQSATAGFIIVRGSDAKDVATGDEYIMDSTGTWRQQPSGVQLDLFGYATTQDLTDGLAAKVDTTTYTAGQAAQDAEIQTKLSIEQLCGIKTNLQSGTDLDDLTAGVVACSGATVAATLLHCPTTTEAFIIYTDYVATSSRRIQRIYSFNTNTGAPSIYIRSRYSGGWSAWYKIDMIQV